MDRESLRPDRLAATLTALAHASAAANATEMFTPEQAQARKTVKECERRLAPLPGRPRRRSRSSVVTQWINEVQRDKDAAQKKLDALPAVTRKKGGAPHRRPDPSDH
ncbi:hypothetical protein ACIQFZ_22385 [Streptomyces sp. NPDC093064]|uniref:hypothetical protein n=1 Tax=unclassified Streptomyces TaxID=2593676 RepID=UPI0034377881